MHFLLELLFNIRYFVGFINNNAFPNKLTEEEEQLLLEQLFNENTHDEARKKLIEHNLRLVAHIAKKYEVNDEASEDLISIGILGLIKAVDTYSKGKDVKLATYAAKCIENEILMSLRSSVKYLKNVSLEESVGIDKDGSEITLFETIPCSQEDYVTMLEKDQNISKLLSYLSILDERELEIISMRYGLNNNEELTQKEIAKKYHISRSYVSRIEKRALTKLLQEFKKNNKL